MSPRPSKAASLARSCCSACSKSCLARRTSSSLPSSSAARRCLS
eukprot:CAMPEP_0177539690 /NCGR_PEP_ID=MMETSP0369-20130122/59116_1 /TAXON_ID=447022 ORGANISM="Scrippsiella hangoei-like, Strain SHHI-4" /NCGR_SAMPLE_ID=MMETSP0369 /ASSEMBLY_ACC=CAM_ASM_000364 /LENGTH=43 /DNA_ID= /DNA_START= /DNA_END= /DNA_ORIENTATION=